MDPLKPFGTIIRSVWDKTVRRTDGREKSGPTAPTVGTRTHAIAESPAVEPLHARLRARVAHLTDWDAEYAREVFVESVLLNELGAELGNDPAFATIVKRISGQLRGDTQLSTRLDTLLKELARESRAG